VEVGNKNCLKETTKTKQKKFIIIFRVSREPIRSSHLTKRNFRSSIDTTSSVKTLRH